MWWTHHRFKRFIRFCSCTINCADFLPLIPRPSICMWIQNLPSEGETLTRGCDVCSWPETKYRAPHSTMQGAIETGLVMNTTWLQLWQHPEVWQANQVALGPSSKHDTCALKVKNIHRSMQDIELEHRGCLFIGSSVWLLTSNFVLKGWKEEIQHETKCYTDRTTCMVQNSPPGYIHVLWRLRIIQ